MTKEELYQLRENVIKNKEVFSELNAKYNALLNKINTANMKKKEEDDDYFILKWAHLLYWIRYWLFSPLIFFGLPFSAVMMLVFINFIWRILDQEYFLPQYLKKKKMKGHKKTKIEREQEELYEEVNKARDLYQSLNKDYEQILSELTDEERVAYQEYLDCVTEIMLSCEEKIGEDKDLDNNKSLNKTYVEEG